MAAKPPPTYDELLTLRSQEWAAAQAKAGKTLAEFHAQLAAMPDVAGAPAPNIPWSHAGIVCPCGGTTFLVTRWVTVNGVRHRTELECQTCQRVDTWDWGLKAWLPWD